LNKFKHIQRTPKDIIKILFVGRFVEKKGASYAIETIDRLLKESHNIELRMIGDGPLMNEAKNLMNELSLNEKIVLLGPQPHSIVLKEMEEADIFFLPSITADNGDREGIPVSIMEAQATGLPVVSTVHSGIPELVIDSKTGFLVPENDTAAMAEKLKELITNYKLRINMGELGRSQIESIYDREKEIDQLDKLFRSVCKNKTLVSKMSEEEINTISQRVGKLGDQLKRLDTEITQKNEQLEQLTKDKKHKNQQIQEKNKEIQEKNKEIQNRNNQIQRVEEKTATLQKRLDTIQSKLAYKAYIKAFSFVDYIGKQIKKIR
jgi:hypothetical protein